MKKESISMGIVLLLAAFFTSATSQAESVDFRNLGSRTVWSADFSEWRRDRDDYGYVRPRHGRYVLEAYDDTWIGSGWEPVSRLESDFIIDVSFSFESISDEPIMEINLSEGGHEPSRLHFRLWIVSSAKTKYSIEETWLTDDHHVRRVRDYADNELVPDDYLDSVRWHRTNRLSLKREGRRMKLYLNGNLLESFRPSRLAIRKLGISLAGESELHINAIRARVPRR